MKTKTKETAKVIGEIILVTVISMLTVLLSARVFKEHWFNPIAMMTLTVTVCIANIRDLRKEQKARCSGAVRYE